jgi:hypothetical protein
LAAHGDTSKVRAMTIADRDPAAQPGVNVADIEQLPVELCLTGAATSTAEIERACEGATRHRGVERAIALAVDATHVLQAAQLLFGTGVVVVGIVGDNDSDVDPTIASRQVLAAGADEIELAGRLLDPGVGMNIRAAVGGDVPLTVNVPNLAGSIDLASVERAILGGADFVKVDWPSADVANMEPIAGLFELLVALQRGGAKVAIPNGELDRVHSLANRIFGPPNRSDEPRQHHVRNYRSLAGAWDL